MRCENCDQPVNSPDQHLWCCDGECVCRCDDDCDCHETEPCEKCDERESCPCNCTGLRRRYAFYSCEYKPLMVNITVTGVDMNSLESIMLADRYERQKAERKRSYKRA